MAGTDKLVYLISNGDFRDSAGQVCWPMQDETLQAVQAAFDRLGISTEVHPRYDPARQHGFLTKQAEGASILSRIDPEAPVVVVLSCWAYSHHVCGPLQTHRGPILVLGNFTGAWPGLVAMLNHAATLERLSVKHSRIWSETFSEDPSFMENLKTWWETGELEQDRSHLIDAQRLVISDQARILGRDLARDIIKNKRIIGQMDPGCMGMLNAVINPAKLGGIGMPIELLSQSDLVAEMGLVDDREAQNHLNWLVDRGVWFNWGTDQFEELVHSQVLEQMKMYSAAARIFQRYGLSAIGIPYQVGLVRCVPASDLPEGMLNNSERPDVIDPVTRETIRPGLPIVHFNEGDVGSAVPQILMNDIYWRKNMPPETTLHDIRWGRTYNDRFVWVFEISGGAPPAHFDGWQNTTVYRQPNMYFPLGGGTCSGVSKPGVITWARFYESFGEIGMDCGLGNVIDLPPVEVRDRLDSTTPVWPIANVHIPGYGRDQCMGTHMSNHITVGYGDILEELVATCLNLGIPTRVAGDTEKTFE